MDTTPDPLPAEPPASRAQRVWAGVLLLGVVLAALQRRRGMGTRSSAWALGLLLALGVGHLLYWQLR